MNNLKSTGGWQTVATYSDRNTAFICKGMLETNDIPVMLTNATISSVYPMTDTWAAIELQVPPQLAGRAKELLRLNGDD